MKITNVRWDDGVSPSPYLLFDLDGRPCIADAEQKFSVVEQGYLVIGFRDGQPSSLPMKRLVSIDGKGILEQDNLLHSPWLAKRMKEADEPNKQLGDCPEEAD
jgi:hypothetical protein